MAAIKRIILSSVPGTLAEATEVFVEDGSGGLDLYIGNSSNVPVLVSANQFVQSADVVEVSDIVNNLTSTDPDKPLSANQGKVLNDTKANLSGENTWDGVQKGFKLQEINKADLANNPYFREEVIVNSINLTDEYIDLTWNAITSSFRHLHFEIEISRTGGGNSISPRGLLQKRFTVDLRDTGVNDFSKSQKVYGNFSGFGQHSISDPFNVGNDMTIRISRASAGNRAVRVVLRAWGYPTGINYIFDELNIGPETSFGGSNNENRNEFENKSLFQDDIEIAGNITAGGDVEVTGTIKGETYAKNSNEGLIHYWDFSHNGADLIGQNHATLNDADIVPSRNGRGISTDTGSEYGAFNIITFNDGQPHTCVAWLKWEGGAPTLSVSPFGNPGGVANSIYVTNGNGDPRFDYRDSTGTHSLITGIDSVTDGEYHCICWDVDSNRVVRLYIDGKFQGSVISSNTGIFYRGIGRGYSNADNNWVGIIDEYRIYDKSITNSGTDTSVIEYLNNNPGQTNYKNNGYQNTPIKQMTPNYTLGIEDAGFLFRIAGDGNITIPAESSVNFDIGTTIAFSANDAMSAGGASIVGDTGVTVQSLNGANSLEDDYASAAIVKIGSDHWRLTGQLV